MGATYFESAFFPLEVDLKTKVLVNSENNTGRRPKTVMVQGMPWNWTASHTHALVKTCVTLCKHLKMATPIRPIRIEKLKPAEKHG